jgi:hypothetical protein
VDKKGSCSLGEKEATPQFSKTAVKKGGYLPAICQATSLWHLVLIGSPTP